MRYIMLVLAVAIGFGPMLLPAAPANAQEDFFMNATYEMRNGFASRRRINVEEVNLGATTGSGGFTIPASAFSVMGDAESGRDEAFANCPLPPDPFALFCMLGFGEFAPVGFQAFPGFPNFAQVASTFTEVNTAPGPIGPGLGVPGSFGFCPLVGNPANGPQPTSISNLPSCTGLGNGSPPDVQGFVQYTDGSGFGGTMVVVRNAAVTVSQLRQFPPAPAQFQHDQELRTGPWPIGLPFPSTPIIVPPNTGPRTQSPVLGPFTSIQTRGTQTVPNQAVLTSFSTGFPWTTGMIRGAEDSCVGGGTCGTPSNPTPFVQFTLTGADNRNTSGQGVVSLVSGGIFQNRDGLSTVNTGLLDMLITIPEPSALLGLGAGALCLLGLARRRA